jgi:ribosome-associated translation inhibitor RaiA
MQEPLQITFRGMGHSDAIERRIRTKAEALEQFYDRMTSCHVTVEAPHHRHHRGNLYSVRVEIDVPGDRIVVGRTRRSHHAHEDVYVAIRDAFDAAVRRLEDYARTRRGKVKRHEVPDHGKVASLFPEAGYGFVQRADGYEVYFHEHSVVDGSFRQLDVGDEVRIVVAEGEGEEGPQASTVVPVGKHHIVGRAGK